MASPKPQPAALKLIGGRSPGRDSGGRVVKTPPSFRRIPPTTPPAHLPKEAKAEWRRVVAELSRLELLKPVDRAALAAYCLTWDRMVSAQKILNEEGLLSENSQGRVRHPAVAIVEAASKELRAWAAEFGLTPSSEQKIGPQTGGTGDDEETNPFA